MLEDHTRIHLLYEFLTSPTELESEGHLVWRQESDLIPFSGSGASLVINFR